MRLTRVGLSWLLGAMILVGCTAQPRDDDLYHSLGQREGIDSLTRALLDEVYADDRIAFLFQDTDRPVLHDLIVDQICMESGGPCEYSGLPMDEAHSGFEIQESEFDAFVEDFILAMEKTGIGFRTQNEVLKIFAPMRGDIVYK